eukprot:gene13593-18243_t
MPFDMRLTKEFPAAVLCKLPDHILYQLFGEWLSIIDVSGLDCALCCNNHSVREQFLRIISETSMHYPLNSSSIPLSPSYWSWLVKRNFSVKELEFRELYNLTVVFGKKLINPSEINQIVVLEKERDYSTTTSNNNNQLSDLCLSYTVLNRVEDISITTDHHYSFSIDEIYKTLSLVCTNLKSLSMTRLNIDDDCLSCILESNKHCLSKLALSNCNRIRGINILPSLLENINELKIHKCGKLKEQGWNIILSGLKNLKALNFYSSFSGVSGLRNTISYLKNLKTLEFSLEFNVFEDFSGMIFPQTLNYLSVEFGNTINEIQFKALFINNLPNTLKYLELGGISEYISEDGFDYAPPSLPKGLTSLNLSKFLSFSNMAILQLFELKIGALKLVTKEAIANLVLSSSLTELKN